MTFPTNGFIKIPNVLKPWDVAHVLKGIEKINFQKQDCFIEIRNDKPKQLQNLHLYNKELFIDKIYENQILPVVKEVVGKEPYLIKNIQIFQKWPGESGDTKVHQDDWYFQLPEDKFAVTCWIALDDADEDHGCLSYSIGSHQCGLLVHHPNDKGKWRIRSGVEGYAGYVDVELSQLKAVPVKSGDMLMHHGRTLHGAAANRGNHVRRALTYILFFNKAS
jgi:phytanoyl-CoA hydroxylase